MRRLRSLGLLVSLCIAAVACTAGGDDDDVASPSPTPPFDADACQIVWLNRVTPGPNGLVDFWIVDVPVGDWTAGTHDYAVPGGPLPRITGLWYERYDLSLETFARRAVAASGSFALTSVTQSSGGFVRLVDTGPQPIWTLDTAGTLVAFQGTSGTGSWQGQLSDPYSATVTPGVGAITIVIEGTSRELGADLTYAVCYQNAAFARPGDESPAGRRSDRTRQTIERIR